MNTTIMEEAKVTSKGQITIPKKIREKLNINPGDKVRFEVEEEGSIRMRHSEASILERAGALHTYGKQEPVSIEEMNEAIKEAAAERYKRSL